MADAVSHNPSVDKEPPILHLPDDVARHTEHAAAVRRDFLAGIQSLCNPIAHNPTHRIVSAATSTPATLQCVTWDRLREATASDEDMHQLLTLIKRGFPQSRHEIPHSLRSYYQYREHLHSTDGVILYRDCIVIPHCLRYDVLSALHSVHQGTTSMTACAESSLWPGMTSDINETRINCLGCNRMAPSQLSAPLAPHTLPAYPFHCVCADFFTYKGTTYLVIVDR